MDNMMTMMMQCMQFPMMMGMMNMCMNMMGMAPGCQQQPMMLQQPQYQQQPMMLQQPQYQQQPMMLQQPQYQQQQQPQQFEVIVRHDHYNYDANGNRTSAKRGKPQRAEQVIEVPATTNGTGSS